MKSGFAILAAAQLAIAGPACAAQDSGLRLHNLSGGATSVSGFGVQSTLTIRLGNQAVVKESERVRLNAHAGPMLTRGNDQRREIGRVVGLAWSPTYGPSMQFAGQDILAYKTQLGAADGEQGDSDKPKKKQGTGSKIAWVAVVAGGVMLSLIGAFVVHCTSNNGNNCSD